MSSEGFDISSYYSRTYESNDPRISWAFEGIDYDEKIGNFGLVGGGAAGTELDIVDTMLGSPPHTLVGATSAGRHTEAYLLVMEDNISYGLKFKRNPQVMKLQEEYHPHTSLHPPHRSQTCHPLLFVWYCLQPYDHLQSRGCTPPAVYSDRSWHILFQKFHFDILE